MTLDLDALCDDLLVTVLAGSVDLRLRMRDEDGHTKVVGRVRNGKADGRWAFFSKLLGLR